MFGPISRLCAGVALAATILGASPAMAQLFRPTTFQLANGMDVVVVENHRAPIVTHMVWYRVGAADEPEGKSGIAHFLEHLMFKGTDVIPPGEFSKQVARLGGRDNAFTSSDYTAYFQNIAVDRLENVMAMEADRMRNLRLTDDLVLPERDVILEERRSRTENNPGALLSEQMSAALFRNHSYGRPIIGWASEIAQLTREDALDFYKRYYAPNNAILVVAGDVTPDQVKALAEKHYGPLKPEDHIAPRKRLVEPPYVAAQRVVMHDERVRQESWRRFYVAPSYTDKNKEAAYALQVLSQILSGGTTSRLYKSLVIEDKIATSAGAGYDPQSLDYGSFSFSGVPMAGKTLADVEAAIDAQIAKLLTEGVTQAEVDRAKNRLIASTAFANDSLTTGARVLGAALTTGQTVADVEDWPNRIQKVTVAQINAAAAQVFKIESSVTGELRPKAAVAAGAGKKDAK